MRRFSGFLGIAVMLVGTAQAALAGGPVEQVEAFHAALESGDREGALSLLSEKVQIFESGWVERSKAEYAAHHLDSDIAFSKAVKSETSESTVLVDDAFAYVTSQGTMKGVFEGAPVNSVNLETMVLQRVGDSWKIVHIHWSSRKVK